MALTMRKYSSPEQWMQVADSVTDSSAAQDLLQGRLLTKIVELHQRWASYTIVLADIG